MSLNVTLTKSSVSEGEQVYAKVTGDVGTYCDLLYGINSIPTSWHDCKGCIYGIAFGDYLDITDWTENNGGNTIYIVAFAYDEDGSSWTSDSVSLTITSSGGGGGGSSSQPDTPTITVNKSTVYGDDQTVTFTARSNSGIVYIYNVANPINTYSPKASGSLSASYTTSEPIASSSGSVTWSTDCYDSDYTSHPWSDYSTCTVQVSDPDTSVSFSPTSSQVCSSVKCTGPSTGSVYWFLDVATEKSYVQGSSSTSSSTGSIRGHKYYSTPSSTLTITQSDIQGCITDGSSRETLYFTIGCKWELPNGYVCAPVWKSGIYQYGQFDAIVKNLTYWNDVNSSTQHTVDGTQINTFYKQFRLSWTNPSKILNYTITNIIVQYSTNQVYWSSLPSSALTTISLEKGKQNIVTVSYNTGGTVYFRVGVVTSNGSTTYTNDLPALTCLVPYFSNLNINTTTELRPYSNETTTFAFNWFDAAPLTSDTDNGESIKIQICIKDDTEKNKTILEVKNYCEAKEIKSEPPEGNYNKLCYNTTTSNYAYYQDLPATTNKLFTDMFPVGTSGKYQYYFKFIYTNAFDESNGVIFTSNYYYVNFNEPPAFGSSDKIDIRFYYYDLPNTKEEIFKILIDSNKTISPATYRYMINPNETLVFKFPRPTDKNDTAEKEDIVSYKLDIYRFDTYNEITPAPSAITNYELLKSYTLDDVAYYREKTEEGDDFVYLYYTLLDDYSFSKFCYFRISAIDSSGESSGYIYYTNDDAPHFILRGRASAAKLVIENVYSSYYESGELIKGIQAYLNVQTGFLEPDLGGTYLQSTDSANSYKYYPNLDKFLKTKNERGYSLELEYSNNSGFLNDGGSNVMESKLLHEMNTSVSTDLYTQSIIKYDENSGYSAKSYQTGKLDIWSESAFEGKRIYVRFKLVLRRGIASVSGGTTLTYRTITSYSPAVTIYNKIPTLSPRSNCIGINTNSLQDGDVIRISNGPSRNNIVLIGENDGAITINLENYTIDGVTIDGGTWS